MDHSLKSFGVLCEVTFFYFVSLLGNQYLSLVINSKPYPLSVLTVPIPGCPVEAFLTEISVILHCISSSAC